MPDDFNEGLLMNTADHDAERPDVPSTPTNAIGDRVQTVAGLNRLLATELAAADACYRASVVFEPLPVAAALRGVTDGHLQRASVLRAAILAQHGHYGVQPAPSGTLADKLSSDAHVVLADLLSQEERAVADYRLTLGQLDDLTRTRIEAELLPAQERALATLASLQPPKADGSV
jgi:hypothetical protein